MRRVSWELSAAMAVVIASSLWYVGMAHQGAPAPSGAIGLTLGIVGMLSMIFAQVSYRLRKRRRDAAWGPMRLWLQLHIFAGIVGPWLVLLHSAGRFHGIAGTAAGLMMVVFLSGILGRFLYTAAPRTLDGSIENLERLERKLAKLERQLPGLGIDPFSSGPWSLATETPPEGWWIVFARPLLVRRKRRAIRDALEAMKLAAGSREKLEKILVERYRLWLQAHSLLATRHLLAAWRLFHVPFAAMMFLAASLHIVGALYYSWMSR